MEILENNFLQWIYLINSESEEVNIATQNIKIQSVSAILNSNRIETADISSRLHVQFNQASPIIKTSVEPGKQAFERQERRVLVKIDNL